MSVICRGNTPAYFSDWKTRGRMLSDIRPVISFRRWPSLLLATVVVQWRAAPISSWRRGCGSCLPAGDGKMRPSMTHATDSISITSSVRTRWFGVTRLTSSGRWGVVTTAGSDSSATVRRPPLNVRQTVACCHAMLPRTHASHSVVISTLQHINVMSTADCLNRTVRPTHTIIE